MSVYDARNLEIADSKEIARVKAKKLSVKAFQDKVTMIYIYIYMYIYIVYKQHNSLTPKQFDSVAKICIFDDIVPHWPATKNWTLEKLLEKYKGTILDIIYLPNYRHI